MKPGFVPVYQQRASPLHLAGAGATSALCGAFALVCLLYPHPLVLTAALAAVAGCAAAAGVGGQLVRALRITLPLGLLVGLINPLVYNEGATVLIRGGTLFGHRFDITLEATMAGLLQGYRVVVFGMAFALFSACVDQDHVLRALRRYSYRSALTAVLATRLVPVLARDAARMSDASRCRPVPGGRLEVARAALSGSLERAVDVAAALEVRGYSHAVRPARAPRRRSRHDARVLGAAALIAAGAVALRIAGAGSVQEYPTLGMPVGVLELALCALVLGAAALPFAGRSARLGVGARG